MTIERLIELVNRKPFKPFVIHLTDGETIEIDSEKTILFPERHPELIIVFSENGAIHLFEYTVIASLVT